MAVSKEKAPTDGSCPPPSPFQSGCSPGPVAALLWAAGCRLSFFMQAATLHLEKEASSPLR